MYVQVSSSTALTAGAWCIVKTRSSLCMCVCLPVHVVHVVHSYTDVYFLNPVSSCASFTQALNRYRLNLYSRKTSSSVSIIGLKDFL